MKVVTGDRKSSCRPLVKGLLLNTACAFIPPILLVALSTERVPLERLLITFRFSLVYANCIGGMNFATMPTLWKAAQRWRIWVRWPLRVAAIFGNTVLGSLIACGVLIAFGWMPRELYWPEFWASLKIATFISILAGVSIGIYETFQWRLEESALQLRTKELERERALKLATAAQLASLESRIHPHFLFNTLNSISSLIPEDPKRAERLVEQMAALLRFSLDANQAGLVPLTAELKVVADYLDIERARFGDRLRYRIDLAADLDAVRVPALAVQTLVENSVKYAEWLSADCRHRSRPGVHAGIGAGRPWPGQSQGPVGHSIWRTCCAPAEPERKSEQHDLNRALYKLAACAPFWLTMKHSRSSACPEC
jgi:hypothetical protein